MLNDILAVGIAAAVVVVLATILGAVERMAKVVRALGWRRETGHPRAPRNRPTPQALKPGAP